MLTYYRWGSVGISQRLPTAPLRYNQSEYHEYYCHISQGSISWVWYFSLDHCFCLDQICCTKYTIWWRLLFNPRKWYHPNRKFICGVRHGQQNTPNTYTTNDLADYFIQYTLDTSWYILSIKLSQKIAQSSSIRARYGMAFLSSVWTTFQLSSFRFAFNIVQ